LEGHAPCRQALKMQNGWDHALAAEPIQGPEQDAIEPASTGVIEELDEGLSISLSSALMIHILVNDGVA